VAGGACRGHAGAVPAGPAEVVGQPGAVADRVVGRGQREVRLAGAAAGGLLGELTAEVVVGVGDDRRLRHGQPDELASRVVTVGRDPAQRVGDRDDAVEVFLPRGAAAAIAAETAKMKMN